MNEQELHELLDSYNTFYRCAGLPEYVLSEIKGNFRDSFLFDSYYAKYWNTYYSKQNLLVKAHDIGLAKFGNDVTEEIRIISEISAEKINNWVTLTETQLYPIAQKIALEKVEEILRRKGFYQRGQTWLKLLSIEAIRNKINNFASQTNLYTKIHRNQVKQLVESSADPKSAILLIRKFLTEYNYLTADSVDTPENVADVTAHNWKKHPSQNEVAAKHHIAPNKNVPENTVIPQAANYSSSAGSSQDIRRKIQAAHDFYEKEDYKKAAEIYFSLKDSDFTSDAMCNVGYMYTNGEGVFKSYSKAIEWYRKSVDAGSSRGMCYLGYMCQKGYGVPQSNSKAVEWFLKSADAGNDMAMYNLGCMYQNGYGVPQSNSKAIEWYQKAANLGNTLAIPCLEKLNYQITDFSYAADTVHELQKAAESGDSKAINTLGVWYFNGDKVGKDFRKAFDLFEKAANAGNSAGMYNLGECYNDGIGISKDLSKALYWIQKAADMNNSKAMCYLGELYKSGRGVSQDYSKAFFWYQKSAETGDSNGMYNTAKCYQTGRGVLKNPAQSVFWFQKSAEAGNTHGMYNLAKLYISGRGVSQDYTKAKIWLQKAADAGNNAAMKMLGDLYMDGNGVLQDFDEAKIWYQKAVEWGNREVIDVLKEITYKSSYSKANFRSQAEISQDIRKKIEEANDFYEKEDYKRAAEIYLSLKESDLTPEAMYRLGILYEEGNGVARDDAQAVYWYQVAANAGYSYAMFNLGMMYYGGTGILQNYNKAIEWYQKAAEAGDSDGMYYLATMYRKGEGVSKNFGEAIKWFQKSAETGDSDAMCALGHMYKKGEGISQDFGKAMEWYQKAAKAGNNRAIEILKEKQQKTAAVPVNRPVSIKTPRRKQKKKDKLYNITVTTLLLSIAGVLLSYFFYFKEKWSDNGYPRYFISAQSISLLPTKAAGIDNNSIVDIPYGAELIVYDYQPDWSYVKVDRKKGYVSSTYILNKDDFLLLDNIFGDAVAKETIKINRHRMALLDYVKSITTDSAQRFNWKIYTRSKDVKFNTIYYAWVTNPSSKFADFAFIIKNIVSGQERAALYSFNNDETPVMVVGENAPANGVITKIVRRSGVYQFYYN